MHFLKESFCSTEIRIKLVHFYHLHCICYFTDFPSFRLYLQMVWGGIHRRVSMSDHRSIACGALLYTVCAMKWQRSLSAKLRKDVGTSTEMA